MNLNDIQRPSWRAWIIYELSINENAIFLRECQVSDILGQEKNEISNYGSILQLYYYLYILLLKRICSASDWFFYHDILNLFPYRTWIWLSIWWLRLCQIFQPISGKLVSTNPLTTSPNPPCHMQHYDMRKEREKACNGEWKAKNK